MKLVERNFDITNVAINNPSKRTAVPGNKYNDTPLRIVE